MNLWDKALRLGLVLLVPSLFFIACEEELKNVGTDTSRSQFDLLFEEFTLQSHVIIDSVKTSGVGLLTGSYVDPEFGTVTSEAYTEFKGTIGLDLSSDKFVFDSLKLSLRLNTYFYGNDSESPIIFKIHELTEKMTNVSGRTNYSEIEYSVNPIGEVSYLFNKEIHEALDPDTLLVIELEDSYFQRIQDSLAVIKTDTTIAKYTTLDISSDNGFYGFAILAEGDKVVGISTASQMSMTYHTLDDGVHKDTTHYEFTFGNSLNRFNKITSDRVGTVLAEVKDDSPSTPFLPTNGLRYVQGGTGITTEIDFQPYLDFFNEKEHVLLNSVELSFGEIKDNAGFSVPTGLSLFNTNDNSEISPLEILGVNFSTVQSDAGVQLYLPYSEFEDENKGVFTALPTQYFQVLYNDKVDKSTAVISSAIVSGNSIVTNSGYIVDRFIVHKDSIKLKVYYTLPK